MTPYRANLNYMMDFKQMMLWYMQFKLEAEEKA